MTTHDIWPLWLKGWLGVSWRWPSRTGLYGTWSPNRCGAKLWHPRWIVLTTTGRRTSRPRTVLIKVFQDGPELYVVAANSGLPRSPGWYLNLVANSRRR
jgi:hypothetical protein